MSVADRLSRALDGRLSRRSFVVRSALVGSALATGGWSYLLRPGTAYGYVCSCGSPDCSCGSACCAGYTEFCCVLDGGYNSCPPGTVMGGWWMAEGSAYCAGPRYYMDCNAICGCSDGCGGGWQFCDPGCDGLSCGCAGGACDNYLSGCFQFRYGQCNQDVSCLGRIKCRVVSCVPPWEVDPSCTTASATDDFTADQTAGCLGPAPTYPPDVVAMAVSKDGHGYGLVEANGVQHHFGDELSSIPPAHLGSPVAAMAACATGGWWLVCRDGTVLAQHAVGHGHPLRPPADPVVALAGAPDGGGYWIATSTGEVLGFGSAATFGSVDPGRLAAPAVALVADPAGGGYWLVARDGAVIAFGSARSHGDAAPLHLQEPFVAAAATPGGMGYWLVTAAGRVRWFGDAVHYGGTADRSVPAPIVAMAATHTGGGYYLAGRDGSVYPFGDAADLGQVPGAAG